MTTLSALTVVYRGQLGIERSRIEFILKAACSAAESVDVIQLFPGRGSDEEELRALTSRYPQVRNVTFLPAQLTQVLRVRRVLPKMIAPDAPSIAAIGFSVWAFILGLPVLAWFINGIPEERLLTRATWRDHLAVRISWWGAGRIRAALTVVVSEAMADLIRQRLNSPRVLVVPNVVDRFTYRADEDAAPKYLTYQGGGSPWQGLDHLAQVWGALHRLDGTLRFRVISKDYRTRVLGQELPSSVIDFTAAETPEAVASLLAEAKLGFLYREGSLVNRVSWPMKFAEYLGAGVPVVVTNCGWDLAPLVSLHDAGLVVSWEAPPKETAEALADYLSQIEGTRPPGVAAVAQALDSTPWNRVLADALSDAE